MIGTRAKWINHNSNKKHTISKEKWARAREVFEIMIETNRLILRLMNENDIDDILKIFTDKNVMKSFDLQSLIENK
jgi:Na+/phosphate symporter